MKKEIIKTDKYLLVVDDLEIKAGDWFFEKAGRLGPICFNEGKVNFHMKKIIAHLPLNDSPVLEGVPLLPPLKIEDNVEKMAEDSADHFRYLDLHGYVGGFVQGYNKAREKYKFTEEDIKYMFECGRNFQINADITFTVAREHLLQPKMPTHFEFEETIFIASNASASEITLTHEGVRDVVLKGIKTTTNSQGQEVACGKYIFEP